MALGSPRLGTGVGSGTFATGAATSGASATGGGALNDLVGICGWGAGVTGVETDAVNGVGGAENVDPVSRLRRMGEAVFPEKNSPAVRAGSEDGAGGKISDWKESACLQRSGII